MREKLSSATLYLNSQSFRIRGKNPSLQGNIYPSQSERAPPNQSVALPDEQADTWADRAVTQPPIKRILALTAPATGVVPLVLVKPAVKALGLASAAWR